MNKDYVIKMKVNLIEDLVTSTEITEAVCYLEKDVVIESEMKQANFNCNIENLEGGKEYTSFVLHSSDDIKGIPDDSVLLNPVLTEAAIAKGTLPDYSQEDAANSIPAEFTSNSIDSSDCSSAGKFKINGTFKSELKSDLNFKITLFNPVNVTASCSLKKGEKNSNGEIECLIASEINDKIIIEQTSIFDDKKKELIIIGAIESNENVKCSNGELISVNNKANVNLSFRQANQFSSSGGKTTFVLNTISSSSVSSRITAKLKVYLINNKGENQEKEEKEATCSYKSIHDISNSDHKQVDFDCVVDGACDDIEIISSEDVSGINNDLEEILKSPKLTDDEIKNTESKDDSSVGKLYNFNLPEYIDIFPPTLNIEKVESDLCEKYGKLTLTGTFNMDIDQDYDFDLSLSYPSSSIKCTLPRIDKNTKVSISCKVLKEFSKSSQLIIEQMAVKKKYKEILFINSFKSPESSITCKDFNKINEQKLKAKKESHYTFIQASNYRPGRRPTYSLFIYASILFDLTQKLYMEVFLNINNRLRLRNLEEIATDAECTPKKQDQNSGNVQLDCEIVSVQDLSSAQILGLDSDDISGIPESTNPADTDIKIKQGIVLDYSKDEIFSKEIPIVNSAEINGDNCQEDGTFKITNGVSNKEIDQVDGIKNVDIKLSNPISSAFCDISSTNNKNINFNCGSKDNFDISIITLERQFLQKENNTLFILNHTESKDPFSCSINSDYQMVLSKVGNETDIPTTVPQSTEIPEPPIKKRYNFYNSKGNSSGLSGGAIAAIIIVCVVAVIIIGVVFGLIKSGKILGMKRDELQDFSNNSTNAAVFNP